MEDALMELVRSVGEIAPHVWEIALRQAYVNGVLALVGSFFGSLLWIFSFVALRWGIRGMVNDEDTPLPMIATIVGAVLVMVIPFMVYADIRSAVQMLVNPEYEAIKILLNLAGVK